MDGEGHKRPGKLHFPVDFNGEIFTEVISFTEVTKRCTTVRDSEGQAIPCIGGSDVVSFTNPLAAGSGLVERTPKKVGF